MKRERTEYVMYGVLLASFIGATYLFFKLDPFNLSQKTQVSKKTTYTFTTSDKEIISNYIQNEKELKPNKLEKITENEK